MAQGGSDGVGQRQLPESHETYGVCLGEFFWSRIFQKQESGPDRWRDWTRGSRHEGKEMPADVIIANEEYSWGGSGFDCSLDDAILINVPCRYLVRNMALEWHGIEGEWRDAAGNLVAIDPSVRTPGPGALLFRRDKLIEFLEAKGLTLFWTLLGQKRTIGGPRFEEEYQGELEINGALVLKNKGVVGNMLPRFVSPRTRRKKKST